jgi:hypothetical protein
MIGYESKSTGGRGVEKSVGARKVPTRGERERINQRRNGDGDRDPRNHHKARDNQNTYFYIAQLYNCLIGLPKCIIIS